MTNTNETLIKKIRKELRKRNIKLNGITDNYIINVSLSQSLQKLKGVKHPK